MIQVNNTTSIDETDGLLMSRRIWAAVSIGFVPCMSVFGVNIINIAPPMLSYDLGTPPAVTTWTINGYQSAIVVSLLSFPPLGEIIGYRKVLLSGIGLFCITSLVCALSDSFWTLAIVRIFQGFSAPAITSANTVQLRCVYPKSQIGRGIGINAMVVAISAAAGPSVTSGILSIASWYWLFAINVPLGITALLLGIKHLSRQEEQSKRKFDFVNTIANVVTFGLLIYTLDGFAHHEEMDFLVLQLIILAIVGTFYARRQLTQTAPLLPLDLLRIPIFRLSTLTPVCSFTVQMAAIVSLPSLLQNTLGHSKVMTGSLLTPWPLATLVTAPLAGYLVKRIHPGILGSIGMALFAVGFFSSSGFTAEPSDTSIVLRLMFCGAGFGLFQTSNNSTVIFPVLTKRPGGANGVLGMAWLLGQTFGTMLVTLPFSFVMHNQSMAVYLMVGNGFAVVATIVSSLRLSQPSTLKRETNQS